MWQILTKEVSSFFNSLVAYMVIIIFLVSIGLICWVFPQSSILDYGFANLDPMFSLVPYVYMFLIPAITMRTFAEERRTGTIELLLTRPLTDLQLILGKYFASLLLVLFSLLPTLLYYYTVYQLGSPIGNIDTAAVAGSYLGLFLLGAVFTAVGILASLLTDNQIVSFILAVFLSFVLYDGLSSLAQINVWSDYTYVVSQLGIDFHYLALSRGLLDFRNMGYLISVIVVALSGAHVVLSSRKW